MTRLPPESAFFEIDSIDPFHASMTLIPVDFQRINSPR
jgi:hypothetical protein